MNKTLIELTDANGEPVLIDPTAIVSVAPDRNILVIPEEPRTRTIVNLGSDNVHNIHFVTETSTEVRDRIRAALAPQFPPCCPHTVESADPLAPVHAETDETADEYEDQADEPVKPGSETDTDHATEQARDYPNGL